ncbi:MULTISPECIES: PIN domain-containing protein [unclassified Thiocapsa]|uniref:PIN domain-containing protein n=1 Tax=unclassified Thiocapsa TaxID=2641286 RepID=UPI0035B388BB
MPKPANLLDTNIVSDLVRRPAGRIRDCIAERGEGQVCTSIIVAAELRFGAAKKPMREGSARQFICSDCSCSPPIARGQCCGSVSARKSCSAQHLGRTGGK